MFNHTPVNGRETPREWVKVGDFTLHLRPATDDRVTCHRVLVSQKYGSRVTILKSDTWLNVGAHIGAFALQVHKVGGKVICFEAEYDNFRLLQENVKFNEMPWHNKPPVCFHSALSARPDRWLTLMINEYAGKSQHSLTVPRNRKPIRVPNLSISVALAQIKADCIKISAPGVEYELLNGITGIQFRNIRQFVLDWHLGAKRDKPRYEHAIEILQARFKSISYVPFAQLSASCSSTLIVASKE